MTLGEDTVVLTWTVMGITTILTELQEVAKKEVAKKEVAKKEKARVITLTEAKATNIKTDRQPF